MRPTKAYTLQILHQNRLYDGKREPRHGRLSAGGGRLSFEAVGSGASHGGGQSPAGVSAAL